MNTSYLSIKKSIEANIQYLQNDTSVIQNFIDVETLEEFWNAIELDETDPKEFRRKRQEIEDEIHLFTRIIRGMYLEVQKTHKEPDWLKSGHKEKEVFFMEFFKHIKELGPKTLDQAAQITQKSISDYRDLFMQWKIAKKRELDAQSIITQKMKQARSLKKTLEKLLELSKAT